MASEQRHRCEECGGELTCCGPMTEDGPLLDCLLCQRSEIITKLKAQLAARDQQAGNVLARIHRDGGHYITQHGWEKACVDADAVVCRLQAQLAASEEKRLLLVAEVLSGRNKETAHHEYDCQYVGCIEKSQCPAWSAEKDYEAAKEATDAAKAMEAP